MNDPRPRFRQDLLAEQIEDGRFIDVMDPDSGNVFRFYEVEFSLACGMDGERDVAGIVKWAKDELGLAPSPTEVQKMISTLGDLGYLDRGAEARAAVAAAVAGPPPPELGQGVVVGAKPVNAQQSAVELGIPGTSRDQGPDMPSAPDIALGAPGTGPTPRVAPPVEDVPLGQAGRIEAPRVATKPQPVSDVSIDLADQMTIRPDDVKEAVRASKVMQAVDVPPELLETKQPSPVLRPPAEPTRRPEPDHGVTRPGTPPPVHVPTAPRAPTPLPFEAAKPPAPEVKPPAPAEVKPPPVAEVRPPTPSKPPVELKPPVDTKKPPVENKPIAPPAPEPKTSRALIIILILVLVGAGTFAAWYWLIRKTDEEPAKTNPAPTQPVKKDPAPPKEPDKPPPPPPVKLALVPGVSADVKPTGINAGLEFIEAAKPVKEGDVIARHYGAAGPTQAYKNARTLETKAQAEVDAATAAAQKAKDDKAPEAKVKEADAAVEAKQKALDKAKTEATKAKEEYAKYVYTSPIDGDLKPVAKPTPNKLAADAIVATVTPPTTLVATFPAAEGVAAGASVYVNVKKPESKLTCKVVAADNAGVKVSCPAKDDFSQTLNDAEVALGGPAPDEPPPADVGSGSGSAAKAGSGSAATAPKAGSGAAVPLKQFPKDPPKDTPKDPAKDPPKDPAPAGSSS